MLLTINPKKLALISPVLAPGFIIFGPRETDE
jgi:hypothetical protein